MSEINKLIPARPWHYQEESDVYTHILRGLNNEHIIQGRQETSGKTEAVFRHIATCVNTYEEREALLKEMREGLEDAKHQIEYMHKKFQRTGSGNQVLSRIETLLSKHTS